MRRSASSARKPAARRRIRRPQHDRVRPTARRPLWAKSSRRLTAEFEVGEQNLLTEIMHSFADPNATASTTRGAQAAASTAPELPAKDAQAMERLSKAQGGAAFDKDYVALQIQGHQELLKLQETYLQQGSGNRETTNLAKLARNQIQEHLTMLQDIQKELGR
jgi:putative membrane protein